MLWPGPVPGADGQDTRAIQPQARGEPMNEAIAIVITGALIVAAAIVIAGGAISTQISSM
jgi:hypothetical protein